ncbi:LEAF RUST 10 DISEASE-RESISTANCE LOCUS RECEPTOR-LIKE PROTEIN KINASE-like 2.3 [Juglans regia]|uniref:LEAF RUST 10 DISEASE-RESISTANCE LOCUS RECEPTOR-LIKE PROTEIN KINASE-like 2.3 n=2 Tax=Juglans regia TaxID=51240 RepID=A0A6P9EBF5_JUGRE|nr:LEAF RUST 10 DISEASE-RESISTANCE LOCUS RECEPTOR-LIKE PROTEIN KINASE-like 2.3 [Juglans regia]
MKTGVLSLPAELMALIVLVVLLLHQTCSATDSNPACVPSSCGNIPNISSPFRLQNDPPNCGNPSYTLSCQDNQTVLYLFSVEHYVQEINYTSQTIRVVDSGIQKDNYSYIPGYHFDLWKDTPYYPQNERENMVFLNCEKRVNSSQYLNKSTCFGNRAYASNSSSSQPEAGFRYVIYNQTKAGVVEDLCQVEHIFPTSWPSVRNLLPEDSSSISCTDLHNLLLYGFELSWWTPSTYCGNCGIFEFSVQRYCCKRHTGILGIPFWVFRALRGLLGHLYSVIQDKVKQTDRGRRIDNRITYYIDGVSYKGSLIQVLMIIIIDLGVCHHGAKIIMGTPFVLAFLIYKWRRRHLSAFDIIEEFLQNNNNLMPIRYSYSEVRKMTKNFKDKIGEGGYGTVFKGTLRSGRLVAIKMLGKSKANGQEFISEVTTIGRIHHINVVQLIGFCVEGSKRALIYEFMPNGSLNKYIFSQEGSILLSYEKMHDIALGVAHGIEYLHRGCQMQILHFDIKPHNILLDEDFTPKVSDFGLAKLYHMDDNTISLTAVRGTLGYMAPELCYKNIGSISYKADVYSFGMLLMDMMGRRKNMNAIADQSSKYFPTYVYEEVQDENGIKIENATEDEKKIAKQIIIVALWCIQMKPNDRPSMNKVVEMLEGGIERLQIPPKPFLSSPERQPEDIEDNSNQTFLSSQYTQSSIQSN